ncbi:MAG: DUF2953 domain-containing protein [Candidatus Latescibacteria bacterium]|nr:DUF2953 domain-containing protein [Candidatus Latescibacterota bacterium]
MIIVAFLVLVPLLFVLLPIRICGSGRYEDGVATFWGWVRPWAGLVGVRISYTEGQLRAGLMLLGWVPLSFDLRRSGEGTSEGDGESIQSDPVEPAKPGPEAAGPGEADTRKPEEAQSEQADGAEVEPGTPLRERAAGTRELIGRIRLYARKLRGPVLRFLGRMLHVVRLRRVACRLTVGAPDPATTGKIFGYALAIQNVLGERADLQVTPDFERVRLEGRLRLEAVVYLYRLLWAVVCIATRAALAWLADVWVRKRRRRKTVRSPATG